MDESIESFVKGLTIIKNVVIAEELSFDDDKDDLYFIVCSDLFHGGQTVVLAGCYGG